MFAGVDVVHEFHIAESKVVDDLDPEVQVKLIVIFLCIYNLIYSLC